MASTGVVQGSVVSPTDLMAQKTVTESTFSSTGTVIVEEVPTTESSDNIRATLDDSDDDLSIGSKNPISPSRHMISEGKAFRELNESVERQHMLSEAKDASGGSEVLSLGDLKEEYDEFEEMSEHWQSQHHHHHIDDILYMHVTETEASDILLRGIDIAESWNDKGLLTLYKGQYMMRNMQYENATVKFEESLSHYKERTPEYCLEHGALDLMPHICALLIESYYLQGALHRAISVARDWIEKYPTSPSPRCALAWTLREMEQWGDSIAACTVGIDKLPETEIIMTLYDIRGKNYYTLGEYEKAAHDFEKVKAMSAKNLTRFAREKPEFLKISHSNPKRAPPKVIPKARPDLLMRATKENQRVMELYSVHLADNRATTPQPSPQTYEDLLKVQLSAQTQRSASGAKGMNPTCAFFQTLYETARAELRAAEAASLKNSKARRVYTVNETIGRHCAKCHQGHNFESPMNVSGSSFSPTKPHSVVMKRLLTEHLGQYL